MAKASETTVGDGIDCENSRALGRECLSSAFSVLLCPPDVTRRANGTTEDTASTEIAQRILDLPYAYSPQRGLSHAAVRRENC